MLFVRRLFDLYRDHSWQCVTAFFVLYFVILIGGAAIFKSIEEPAEKISLNALKRERDIFLQKLRGSCNSSAITEQDVDRFAKAVMYHGFQRISVYENFTSESNWGLGQAIFFAGTIITTLGYAQTTYLTDGGKIFAIFFVCIGVPFTLFFFTACVHKVNRFFMWQKSWLAIYCPSLTDLQCRLLHFAAVCLVLWITLLMIPAAIFCGIEQWAFLDAFFYTFVSMTTVGMVNDLPGDQPGQQNKSLYKLSVLLYLYIGLIGVLSALRLFSDISPSDDSDHIGLPVSSANSSYASNTGAPVDSFRPQRLKEEREVLETVDSRGNYASMNTLHAINSSPQDGESSP